MPELPVGAALDSHEQARYREYKRSHQGHASYVALEGDFHRYLEDVHSDEPIRREALHDECEVLVVGAGFAALILWHTLSRAGFDDVRFCERGGDVGGTWYWNRYPGVACDVEAYSYLPLLDELGYIPTMKFASGMEIMEHCQRIAAFTGFYDHALFHTVVERSCWDQRSERWIVTTDRGDRIRARFLVLANGILTTPKLARIAGMEKFRGASFHTSRWDYRVDLKGKRVGIIGTGATAVQVIPEIAKVVGSLHVFQRTPSSIDVRNQRETTAAEIEAWRNESGWAKARRSRYAKILNVRDAIYADDDYLSGRKPDFRERKSHASDLGPEELVNRVLEKNLLLMKRIRARIDSIVEDPATAELLKPYYPYGCKRPVVHDEYLPTFNLPHVTLVDTAPEGVQEINELGVVHRGVQYEFDVLIYATGFQYMASATFAHIEDGHGRSLKQKWDQGGTRTLLGVHSRGFPNLLVIAGPQGGGGSFNFTNVIEDQVGYVTWVLDHMKARGYSTVDVTETAEEAYAQHCREADQLTRPLRDCLSYYNGEGNARPGDLAYYGGVQAWHAYRDRVQADETAFVFTPASRGAVDSQEAAGDS
ncbi:MAG: NAD(P)/FAD-dependent oxidoreductase [Pseudomonadales bacterium]|nr:NAD(P)/FAD-dependent oxidoreductase [Pseudomonadales bacterium]